MGDAVDSIQNLVLSGLEVREMTGWPDAMVEDYLNILQNLLNIANAADGNTDDIAANAANIAQNASDIAVNAANIASNASQIVSLQNNKADKIAPAVTNNIAVLDASGNLADGGSLIADLLTLDFAGNPNGNVTSNRSRLCVDTAGNQIYFNPTVGVNVGWVAV